MYRYNVCTTHYYFYVQVYGRLNHLKVCVSYPATLKLMDKVSKMHSVPLKKWIEDGVVFKFWGDNVDKTRKVHDLRSDNQGKMLQEIASRLSS